MAALYFQVLHPDDEFRASPHRYIYIVPLSGIQFSAPFFHFIVVIAIIFF
jgi:hypothetical protein